MSYPSLDFKRSWKSLKTKSYESWVEKGYLDVTELRNFTETALLIVLVLWIGCGSGGCHFSF
jgi:hypothetical protein